MRITFIYLDLAANEPTYTGYFHHGIASLSASLKEAGHKTALLQLTKEISTEEFKEKIKDLQSKVSCNIKYDRMIKDYYHNKKVSCEIAKIIVVIGGNNKRYVCCEHAYEPDFEVGVWDGSTKKCGQCRYANYNEIIDMFLNNTFTKEFL